METNVYTNTTIDNKIDSSSYRSIINIEFGFLAFVAVIGLIGSLYIFNINSDLGGQPNKVSYAFIPANAPEYDNKELLFIENQELTISVHQLDRTQKDLILNLGDGNQIELSGPRTDYTYEEAGVYNVVLSDASGDKVINSYEIKITE